MKEMKESKRLGEEKENNSDTLLGKRAELIGR